MRYAYRYSKAFQERWGSFENPEGLSAEEVRKIAEKQVGPGTLYVEVPELATVSIGAESGSEAPSAVEDKASATAPGAERSESGDASRVLAGSSVSE